MKIGIHITFFYVEDRLPYLQKVVQNIYELKAETQIFIYTNEEFELPFQEGSIQYIIYKYQKNIFRFGYNSLFNRMGLKQLLHPFYLTWENREKISARIEEFDVQVYLEDDMAFTQENLEYWLQHKDAVLKANYNLGFLRTELDSQDVYITDLTSPLSQTVEINGDHYLLNNNNPYYGFWIMDKIELKKFIQSEEWSMQFEQYGIREKSAIGWHGENMSKYKGTLIPLETRETGHFTSEGAAIRHLPNNYIGHETFCTVKFPIAIEDLNT
ncbi:hypothetical protein FEE95_19435 [Maribacter algarum]|uniref:Glycosyl transferase n=1 Tax=Maribacter algarum (ex Zhang et al. 2020) TaxID=2578118 RepID=A0A5S3PGJ2_9FLAO|nr:hypothetical protein [Maribacter algarum]TMM53242.1 hypothetical protein FEE95_19435 [Maribacter algarum]